MLLNLNVSVILLLIYMMCINNNKYGLVSCKELSSDNIEDNTQYNTHDSIVLKIRLQKKFFYVEGCDSLSMTPKQLYEVNLTELKKSSSIWWVGVSEKAAVRAIGCQPQVLPLSYSSDGFSIWRVNGDVITRLEPEKQISYTFVRNISRIQYNNEIKHLSEGIQHLIFNISCTDTPYTQWRLVDDYGFIYCEDKKSPDNGKVLRKFAAWQDTVRKIGRNIHQRGLIVGSVFGVAVCIVICLLICIVIRLKRKPKSSGPWGERRPSMYPKDRPPTPPTCVTTTVTLL